MGNSLESEVLLAFVLGKTREFLIAHPEEEVAKDAGKRFAFLCKKRVSTIPLNYLTHHREFYGLDFYVDSRVLIPRPETELLVDEVLDFCGNSKELLEKPRICDVGTGSGCIAVSLAKNLPQATITAIDISKPALCVAKKNAKIHGVFGKINFLQSDLLGKISKGKFDCMVANLPYISQKETVSLAREIVDHEPHIALFGGKKGTELFEKLFGQILKMKFKPEMLIGEIGFSQKNKISQLIKIQLGKCVQSVEWKKDLAGHNRTFIIRFHN